MFRSLYEFLPLWSCMYACMYVLDELGSGIVSLEGECYPVLHILIHCS